MENKRRRFWRKAVKFVVYTFIVFKYFIEKIVLMGLFFMEFFD